MSAQSSAQAVGTPPRSTLLQRLKGNLSASTASAMSPTAVPPEPVAPPAEEPIAPVVPEGEPIELDQLAEEIHADTQIPQPTEETLPVVEEPVTPDVPEVVAAAVPTAVDSMTDTLNPPNAVGGGIAKEAPLLSVTVEHPAVDQAGGVQYVETEKSHELPPEVEGFLKNVEDNVDQIPQEIVISDPQSGQVLPRVMAQPVVVLPITPQVEDEGKNKPTTYSIRWLIEWSWKMMKSFSGKVVYRDEPAQ